MTGERIITVPNVFAMFAIIWGSFCAWPYTHLFAKNPMIYRPMANIAGEEFWGITMIAAGVSALLLHTYGYIKGAAVLLGITFTSFAVLYALADLESPAWALYGFIALCNYAMFWARLWRRCTLQLRDVLGTAMAQIDPQQAQQGFSWIGLTVMAILSLLGGGTLITVLGKAIWDRYFARKDKGEEIHATNQAEAIKADGLFRADLIKRIETLEHKIERMQEEQLSQARTNERLTAENEHLKEDKNRQELEITDLKQRNRTLNDKVGELTGLVHKLEIRISELTGQPLDVRLVDVASAAGEEG